MYSFCTFFALFCSLTAADSSGTPSFMSSPILSLHLKSVPKLGPIVRDKTQNEKTYFHTTCAAQEGRQPMSFEWQRNGLPLSSGPEGHFRIDTSDMYSTLTIKSIVRSDAGNYTCTALNSAGTASQSVVLTVNGKSENHCQSDQLVAQSVP